MSRAPACTPACVNALPPLQRHRSAWACTGCLDNGQRHRQTMLPRTLPTRPLQPRPRLEWCCSHMPAACCPTPTQGQAVLHVSSSPRGQQPQPLTHDQAFLTCTPDQPPPPFLATREEELKRVVTLGAADEDGDDIVSWVERTRQQPQRKEVDEEEVGSCWGCCWVVLVHSVVLPG